MKITVIGKAHLKGVSKKTGNPYDFVQLHYNGKARGVEGTAALQVNVDPQLFPYDKIKLGAEYELDFDNRGYLVAFEEVKF